MMTILTNRVINSPVDEVWNIISDIDKDPEFWYGTKTIRNIKREDNIIERETIIAFRESTSKEIVRLHAKKQIITEIIEGPIIGKKIITIEKIDEKKSRVLVTWNIQLRGLMRLFTFMVKKHILKGTDDALKRIAEKAEKS